MPDKDCVITIMTHLLFKNWEKSWKWNVETLVGLTLLKHYNAAWALIHLGLQKFHLSLKWRQMLYSDFKMGYKTCFDQDDFQILRSFFNVLFSTVWKTVFLSL